MKTLGRYLNKDLIRMVSLALLGLLALYLFFDFIGQLNDLGKGNYQLTDALIYVTLQIPSRAYELMPIAVLMGTIFTLSLLSVHSEITVIRTAGISLKKLSSWLAYTGILCAIITFVVGEYVVPYSERQAEQFKLQATKSMVVGQFSSGVWVKDKQSFINIKKMLPDLTLQSIRIYTFDQKLRLTEIREAQQGVYQHDNNWLLEQSVQTIFLPDHLGVEVKTLPSFIWKTPISPQMLSVLLVSPDKMSAIALYKYTKHLKDNKQKTLSYEIAFWNKLFYPFVCIAMIIIALPFSLGQQRSMNIGFKLFIGIIIGLSFYFFSKVMAYVGQLYAWHPLFVVFLPLFIFLGTSLYLLKRQERR
jgi:lipopolysaccharide export system permease protein